MFGFRPSHGRIPLEGIVPLAPNFDLVDEAIAQALEPATSTVATLISKSEMITISSTGLSEQITTCLNELLGDDAVLCLPTTPGIAPLRNTSGDKLTTFRSSESFKIGPSIELK